MPSFYANTTMQRGNRVSPRLNVNYVHYSHSVPRNISAYYSKHTNTQHECNCYYISLVKSNYINDYLEVYGYRFYNLGWNWEQDQTSSCSSGSERNFKKFWCSIRQKNKLNKFLERIGTEMLTTQIFEKSGKKRCILIATGTFFLRIQSRHEFKIYFSERQKINKYFLLMMK